jgi:hypothetical protein
MPANMSVSRFQKKVRPQYNQNLINRGVTIPAGIYLGEVTSNEDPDGYGRIKVLVYKLFPAIVPDNPSGETESEQSDLGSLWCQRVTPFGGVTAQGGPTSTSYGVLGPPPDVGNTVIVAYTGDYKSGIIMGVLPDLIRQDSANTGKPAGQTQEGVGAAFEPQEDGTRQSRPITPGTAQDFLKDDTIRGPQRPNPNNMGMTDRTGNAISLSPGDPEDNTGSGIRIVTSQGSQIVMDDRTGTIYINNRSGTSWLEMNNNGDVDLYCQGTFSVNAVGGFNFHTANNFSVQADEAINMKSLGGGGIKIQSAEGSIDMNSLLDFNLTAQGGQLQVNTGGNILLSSRAQIHLNGPTADRAKTPSIANQLGNKGVTQSISGRVPEPEPWRGHLDYSPDADSSGNPNEYSTAPGAGVNPQRAGNQYQPIAEDASDLVFWDDNVDRRINPDLFSSVEAIAREYGKPFRITKGYIEPSRSGGTSEADNSMHMKGEAVDIVHASGIPNMTKTQIFQLIDLARSNGIGGIGIYSDARPDAPLANKMHFDLGRDRIWGRCNDGTLSYDCLPQIIKDRAEELGYNPDIPAEDSKSSNITEPPAGSSLTPEERAKLNQNEQKAIEVYRAFREAGYSHNQAIAFTGEVYRENGFREQFMYGTHSDPYNNSTNAGIISWQKDRRTNLLNYLQSKGRIDSKGNVIPGYDTLVAQAEFTKLEINTNNSYNRTKNQFLSNPDIGLDDARDILGENYIRWRINDPNYRSSGINNINSGIGFLSSGLSKLE